MPIHPLWLALGLAALLGVAARAAWARRGERQACLELARGHRLTFSPKDHIGLHERYQDLRLIRRGHGRHARNVLHGMTEAGALSLFSYRVECGFGLGRGVREWQVAVVELATAQAPWTAGVARRDSRFGWAREGILTPVDLGGSEKGFSHQPEETSHRPEGNSHQPGTGEASFIQTGPLWIRARHQHTLDRLRESGVIRLLESAPPGAEVEVRGRLAAMAVPAEQARGKLERLPALVVELGICLSE